MNVSIPSGPIKSRRPGNQLVSGHSWFQFHLVQLKVDGIEYHLAEGVFQFHLVQLKEVCPLHPAALLFVSIPSGPIKSARLRCPSGRGFDVSIPSGPIKRRTPS